MWHSHVSDLIAYNSNISFSLKALLKMRKFFIFPLK